MSRKRSLIVLFSLILCSSVLLPRFLGGTDPRSSTIINGDAGENQAVRQPETNEKETPLQVAVSMHPSEFAMLYRLTGAFETGHPGIRIQLQNIESDKAYSELKNAAMFGEAPDVMLLDNAWVNDFAASGYLLPVDEFFTSELQSQQIRSMMEQVKWNGYIWGIPKDADPYIMAWNRQRFAEKHFSGPPESPESLLSMNRVFTQPEQKKYGLYFEPDDPYAFISIVWSLGVSWGSGTDGAQANLHEPDKAKRLETLLMTLEETFGGETESPAAPPQPQAEGNPWERLNNGSIAMLIATVSQYKQNAAKGAEMAQLPAAKENGTLKGSWLKGRSYCISARSPYAKEAFQWIQTMTEVEAQLKMMEAGGGLPALISAYETLQMRNDPHFQQYVISMERGRVFSAQPELPLKTEILQSQLEKLRKGEQTVKQFAERVEQLWSSLNPE